MGLTYAAPVWRSSGPATAPLRMEGGEQRYFGADRTMPLAALRKNSACGLNAGCRMLKVRKNTPMLPSSIEQAVRALRSTVRPSIAASPGLCAIREYVVSGDESSIKMMV